MPIFEQPTKNTPKFTDEFTQEESISDGEIVKKYLGELKIISGETDRLKDDVQPMLSKEAYDYEKEQLIERNQELFQQLEYTKKHFDEYNQNMLLQTITVLNDVLRSCESDQSELIKLTKDKLIKYIEKL